MPLFEYRCANGHLTEKLVRRDFVPSEQICEECRQPAFLQIAQVAPFQWGKGGDWK